MKYSKLKAEVERILREKNTETVNDLESLIADGPVMSDEKYNEFEENRKHFSQWRAS